MLAILIEMQPTRRPPAFYNGLCAQMGLVHFVLHKWVWFTLFCTNGFGSLCFAQMALVHFVLHKWVWFTLFCANGFGSVRFAKVAVSSICIWRFVRCASGRIEFADCAFAP